MTLPPIVALAEGRKPRLRKAPIGRAKEIALQMSVAQVLREHCRPNWQWTHIANGELRDLRTAVKLKRMGVRRGWPDFILVPSRGQLHCLELKREGERLTPDQEDFHLRCIRHGVPHVVAFDFGQVLTAFEQ